MNYQLKKLHEPSDVLTIQPVLGKQGFDSR